MRLSSSFEIVPVLDLLGGQVVRAVGGERATYAPLCSPLVPDAAPRTLAKAYHQLGFRQMYLADLDAILQGTLNLELYAEVARQGLSLWLDPGVRSREQLDRLYDAGTVDQLVVGLETLTEWELLTEAVERFGPERVLFSLDLKHGKPLGCAALKHRDSLMALGEQAFACGARQMILLDLAQVGQGGGGWLPAEWRALLHAYPQVVFYTGGGVRSRADLLPLAEAGFTGALIGTALHQGTLTP